MSTRQQRIDYLFGRGSQEAMRIIQDELQREPEGETAQFLAHYRTMARAADRVDWPALLDRLIPKPVTAPGENLNPMGKIPDWVLDMKKTGLSTKIQFDLVDQVDRVVQGPVNSELITSGALGIHESPAPNTTSSRSDR